MRGTAVLAVLGLASGGTGPGFAQGAPGDTLRPRLLDPVVVTAERARGPLSGSAAAVTRLSGTDLVRFPQATLADLLRLAPGFTVVNFDGLGFDPQIMVRGFYGGGEAEYVILLVDGTPVSRLESGVFAWDALPPAASIEAIEIVRGGGSSLYGDAAIAGVINVITGERPAGRTAGRWGMSGGSHGTWRGHGEVSGRVGRRNIRLGAAADRTSGWRDHARRTAVRVRVGLPVVQGPGTSVRVTGMSHWRRYEEPGPLLESHAEVDRRSSEPLFRFDRTTDRQLAALIESRIARGQTTTSGFLTAELREVDAIRTLALAPGFGDTQERLASSRRVVGSVQLAREDTPLPGRGRAIVGIETTLGWLDSRYFAYQSGTREDYAAASGQRGELDSRGASRRLAGAAFARYTVRAGPGRLALGARWDGLSDRFEPREPAGDPARTDHGALSPSAGINVSYWGNERTTGSGHAYASVSRSFKAPTLDQLYDGRRIPVPFPPFQIQTSNPDLAPQRGTNLEAGLYHEGQVLGLRSAVTLSGYQITMTDEIDFDLATLRYVNIGRSRHRGVELGVLGDGSGGAVFATGSVQAAVARSGEHGGKRLKAIPRHTLTAGGSLHPLARRDRLGVSVLVTHARDIWLDDANTVPLPAHTRVDLRVMVRAAGLELFGDMRNVLGTRSSSTGYLDPSGSGEVYLFPAAGRVVEVGVRGER